MHFKIYSEPDLLYTDVTKEILSTSLQNMGLASGNTMVPLYKKLSQKKDWQKNNFFLLDEYYGLHIENSQSFYSYIKENFLSSVKVNDFYYFNPQSQDPVSHCKDYENVIKKKGGIDLQLLGLGTNGHIAFNEPASEKNSRCRLVDLSKETIEANQASFLPNSKVPKKAFTLGIANILEAKKIILIALGKKKAQAVKELIEGKEHRDWPCTFLKGHKNLRIYLDDDAASLLTIEI